MVKNSKFGKFDQAIWDSEKKWEFNHDATEITGFMKNIVLEIKLKFFKDCNERKSDNLFTEKLLQTVHTNNTHPSQLEYFNLLMNNKNFLYDIHIHHSEQCLNNSNDLDREKEEDEYIKKSGGMVAVNDILNIANKDSTGSTPIHTNEQPCTLCFSANTKQNLYFSAGDWWGKNNNSEIFEMFEMFETAMKNKDEVKFNDMCTKILLRYPKLEEYISNCRKNLQFKKL